MVASVPIPVYPRLHLFGGSLRGPVSGGILWLEGGYFDSRQDRNGIDPFMPNSSFSALIGFERQIATNLTVNGQWQVGYLNHYDTFKGEQQTAGALFIRDETRHLLTSRITKLLHQELVTLSTFIFYSPTDEDLYLRLSTEYKYSDEVILAFGGNLFAGKHEATDFGQLQKNDNLYLKVTYGF